MEKEGFFAKGKVARLAIPALLVLVAAAAGWTAAWFHSGSTTSLTSGEREAIEIVVRDYILEHPEILPEAIGVLQRRENAKQLAGIADEVHTPFPGAVLGNPKGAVTLVEFSDFACGFCRKSAGDIEALIAGNPDLRIVIRELPIISPYSADAASMGPAAAEQGKYARFHDAMFASGRVDPTTIEAAARKAGLDMGKARKTAQSPRVRQELEKNMAFARQLQFDGTPSWIAGGRLIAGAVGLESLEEAVKAVRAGDHSAR
jgi:protein-disulfide isomerase